MSSTEAETGMNILQVLHCVQTPQPPPIQGQSDVSLEALGHFLVSMSRQMK